MNIHTERFTVADVAKAWKRQYFDPHNACWKYINRPETAEDIYNILNALDTEKTTIDDIEYIIGNESWTRAMCLECQLSITQWVDFGGSARLCRACLEKATEAIRNLT